MSNRLYHRDFLKEIDFTPEDLTYLLDLAAQLKQAKKVRREPKFLQDRNIVILFEKDSTRTRCSFEVAAYDQGARVTYLGPSGSQMGKKESMADTARVLSRFYDGIEYRGYEQARVEALAEHAGARYNMGNSLMVGSALLGLDFRSVAPKALWTSDEVFEMAVHIAKSTGARITRTESVAEGVKDCDFLSTDVWVSMGEPDSVWKERIDLLTPYRVDAAAMELTGNPQCKFLHCLPSFHNRDTAVGEDIYQRFGIECMEVSDEVFESPRNMAFEEAENRLHTIKAVMVATMAEGPLVFNA